MLILVLVLHVPAGAAAGIIFIGAFLIEDMKRTICIFVLSAITSITDCSPRRGLAVAIGFLGLLQQWN
eukprot:g9020.t1